MSEPYAIKMPQLSDTMTEGVIVSWEKNPGDKIERGDIVATVETDKAIMDVEVFREGYLSGPMSELDSTIPVGADMAYLVATAEEVNSDAASVSATPAVETSTTPVAASARVAVATDTDVAARPAGKNATPYARKLASQMGIDLATIQGTGPEGAIVALDVQVSSARAAAPAAGGAAMAETSVAGNGRAMSGLEKAISQSMASSVTMPTFHVTAHVHLNKLIKAAKEQGVSVTVAIAQACALAMQKFPRMNWCYQPQDKLVERDSVDIGMAVSASDGGLVVPVLHGCESRSLAELHASWGDLVGRARARRLKPDEYANPSFMISNMGMFGVSHFDAIVTPGIAGILAIAANTEAGSPFTITADHRVVNGAEVAMYLNEVKGLIEDPSTWMGPVGKAIPEGDWDYDVLVIGGGPGGEDCARDLVTHGLKVAMVNDSPFPGGECLWRGCIPSKSWRAAADRIRDRAEDARLGVEGTHRSKLNWTQLEQTRRSVLETRGGMALKTDKGVKIDYIQGYARFSGAHEATIDQGGNQDDAHARAVPGDNSQSRKVSFGCAVIATGAPPFVPPIPGAHDGVESGGVLTSDTVWALDKAPKRLVVIGGGAIGVEMAQIFQDFGAKVTLFEAQDRILAEVENEIAAQLTAILNDDPRLNVLAGTQVSSIKGQPGNMQVSYKDAEGKSRSIKTDYVIMATGKRPVLEGLGLDQAGVETANGVITADVRSRTNIPHVFAIGDVIGGLMLAHTAGHQGRVAAATILGEDMKYDESKDCGVIFTRPEAAFVGISMAQAKEQGIDAVEIKVPMSIDAKAMIVNETHGMIKIVADKKTEKIIGVHMLADHADTLIGEAVMMVSAEMKLEQVAHAIHPHPTQTELFGDMARRLLARVRRSRK
ncbi:MAG: FAD-dependent oxidoreductase [Gammaproteobacteria bacterium]|nr:FAD-dependent oxidoreductase [Gammaproteobacteria bacterium]